MEFVGQPTCEAKNMFYIMSSPGIADPLNLEPLCSSCRQPSAGRCWTTRGSGTTRGESACRWSMLLLLLQKLSLNGTTCRRANYFGPGKSDTRCADVLNSNCDDRRYAWGPCTSPQAHQCTPPFADATTALLIQYLGGIGISSWPSHARSPRASLPLIPAVLTPRAGPSSSPSRSTPLPPLPPAAQAPRRPPSEVAKLPKYLLPTTMQTRRRGSTLGASHCRAAKRSWTGGTALCMGSTAPTS